MFIVGKVGGVSVDGRSQYLDKWRLNFHCDLKPVNNFLSAGFQEILACFKSAALTCSGPFNSGSVGLEVGESYTFNFQYTPSINFTVVALVKDIALEDEAEGVARIEITADSTGVFGVTIS